MRRSLDVHALREALLTPGAPWAAVDFQDAVDSTNLEALRRPVPWRVVLTDHQSAGRGRLARTWQAPPRSSIAVSCVLPTTGRSETSTLGWVPLVAGLAVADALTACAGVTAVLKWPNDVLVGPAGAPDDGLRKICGVLCQSADDDRVVVGAGINIDQTPDELPVDTATSLRSCGARVAREDVIRAFLGHLHDGYGAWLAGGGDLADLRGRYRRRCATVGREVELHRPGGATLRGRATGIDDEGRLLVDDGTGSRPHAAGDVVHLRGG